MNTTAKERYEVIARLEKLGIDYQTAQQLRRISLTLQRWFELECGTDNGCIERDETTGKPYWRYSAFSHPLTKYPVRDMEKGAMARLRSIMSRLKGLVPYIQGDCRGASLYILRQEDVEGQNIDQVYTRGVAVY
jgi:hypothetical protein